MDAGQLVSRRDHDRDDRRADRPAGLRARASSSTAFRAPCAQAEALDAMLAAKHRELDHVIEMEVDEAALVDRIDRPLHLHAGAAPAITTATSSRRWPGVCDVCGSTELRPPRRRQCRDGQGAARGLSRPDRADPALLPRASGILRRGRRYGRDRRGDAADRRDPQKTLTSGNLDRLGLLTCGRILI